MNRPLLDQALLAALAPGMPISGTRLAQRLGVTRAAIWKHVADLRASGLPIEARRGAGYRLSWPTQLLDAAKIEAALGPGAAAPVRVYWRLDSTQNELARQPDRWPDLSVILCERQTSGRGRRGRAWRIAPGFSLCLSCLKRFPGGPATLSGLSIAVGVCVARALAQQGIHGLRIKWPNDLVTAQGKLCGILIEVNAESEGPSTARIGIGLNLRLPADVRQTLDQAASDLAACCSQALPDRNQLAASLIQALWEGLRCFESRGLAPFLPEFQALDRLAGCPIRIQSPRGTQYGIGRGINDTGALLMEQDGALIPVTGGEVSVRPVDPRA